MARHLSDAERRLWGRIARTARAYHPKALPLDEFEAMFPANVGITPTPPAPLKKPAPPRGPLADMSGHRPVRRGKLEIDGTLDLHGHTQDTGFRALASFLLQHSGLVITGKGRLGSGVLKSRLHDWIESPELRPLIAGWSQAHQRHGGEGAFYLVLKSRRGAKA
jgi:DNA-nicking Smr family endonuclease